MQGIRRHSYYHKSLQKEFEIITDRENLTGWHSPTITDRTINTVSSLLKIKYVESQKNFERNRILFCSKFLQKPLDISTSNFYWVIVRSKLQKGVLLIFCDSTYLIFNKLETVLIARSVMIRLWHPLFT